MFFHNGNNHNQGQIFDFDEADFISGCEKALERYENDPVNQEGLKLQEEFSKDKLLDNVLSTL